MDLSSLALDIPSRSENVTIRLQSGVAFDLLIKREDLINPFISGNKWRKLKGNINHYFNKEFKGIISFGGAYSNHLYALGHVCANLDVPLVALIRGDGFDPENSTLSTLVSDGHELHFIDRSSYRLKDRSPIVAKIINDYPGYYLIPEGGSNTYVEEGIHDMCDEIDWDVVDLIWVSAGTGATAASTLTYIERHDIECQLNVVSSLKGNFMEGEILKFAKMNGSSKLKVYNSFHFGGYGKRPKELIDFAQKWTTDTNVPLDLIYNSKAMFGLLSEVEDDDEMRSKRHLFINTGGRR